MNPDEVRRNDLERDRLLHVNRHTLDAKPSLVTPVSPTVIDVQRLIRERDQFLRKICAAQELAEHYTGSLWPQEVRDAARTLLDLLNKDFLEVPECVCQKCGSKHGAQPSEESP